MKTAVLVSLSSPVVCSDCGGTITGEALSIKSNSSGVAYKHVFDCMSVKSVQIPETVKASINAIVEYLYSDERDDYESYPEDVRPQNHIYLDVERVMKFMEGIKND